MEEGAEPHPLDHRSGDQGDGDDAEGRLEGHEDELGDFRPFAGREVDAAEETVAEAADQVAGAVEGKRVADRRPGHRGDGDRADAHHERVERVLRTNEAGVEEAERRGHHQDERRRDQHPGGVAGADLPGLVIVHRGDRAHVGVAGADADRVLQRQDEDLAVADLAGAGALAKGVDGRLDELVGDGDLQPDLVGEPHLDGRAAVGLDPLELTPMSLHATHRDPAHVGAVERLEHIVRLLRPHDADHQFHVLPFSRLPPDWRGEPI